MLVSVAIDCEAVSFFVLTLAVDLIHAILELKFALVNWFGRVADVGVPVS